MNEQDRRAVENMCITGEGDIIEQSRGTHKKEGIAQTWSCFYPRVR